MNKMKRYTNWWKVCSLYLRSDESDEIRCLHASKVKLPTLSSKRPHKVDTLVFSQNFPLYVVAADYTSPPSTPSDPMEERRLTEGQLVEVMDMERCDRWLVQTRPTKTCPARQVWVPPAYLEAKTSPAPLARRSTREVFREDVLQISNKQQDATLKRR